MKTFKISLLCLLMCIMSAMSFAQTPEKLSYQAVFRNMYDRLVTDQKVNVQISILQGSAEGTVVFQETQTVTTNAEGIASFEIGAGTAVVGTMADIDWAKGPYFMKAETNPEGGEEMTVVGNIELLSVPYALYAKKAGNTFSGDYNDLKNAPKIPVVPTNISELENNSGYRATETQKLILNGNTLTLSEASNVIELPAYSLFDGSYANVVNKPVGKNTGDLLYWDAKSASWLTVAPGKTNQVLCMGEDMVPFWKDRPGFDNLPVVTTGSAEKIMAVTATINGEVFSVAPIKAQGFFYGVGTADTKVTVANGENLIYNLDGLKDGTEYRYVAFAENANGMVYGDTMNFTTKAFAHPALANFQLSNPQKYQISAACTISDSGYLKITEVGFYIGTTVTPMLDGDKVPATLNGMNFSADLTGLTPETIYYIAPYATNAHGTSFLSASSMSTKPIVVLATVVTEAVSANKQALVLKGKVTDKGKADKMDERGFYYGEKSDPVTNGKKIVSTSTTDAFTATTEDLAYGKTYYVVAYATNEAGEARGDEVTFVHALKKCEGKLMDIEKNEYNVVQIGTQCWMQENMRATHYADGTALEEWTKAKRDAVAKIYGVVKDATIGGTQIFYNWRGATNLDAANTDQTKIVQGICPDGWHIPTYPDFVTLFSSVDPDWKSAAASSSATIANNSNNQLAIQLCAKDGVWEAYNGPGIGTVTATCHTTVNSPGYAWAKENNPDDEKWLWNTSGFSAYPAGYIIKDKTYTGTAAQDYWWNNGTLNLWTSISNGITSSSQAECVKIACYNTGVPHYKAGNEVRSGYSVRCVCDAEFEPVFKNCGDNVQDVEGNSYKTVKIGTQCWMSENLRTKTKPDGTKLGTWQYQKKDTYAEITTDVTTPTNIGPEIYYNWFTATNRTSGNTNESTLVQGLCPDGWHIPSRAEYQKLCMVVDPDYTAAQFQNSAPVSKNQLAIKLCSNDGHWKAYASSGNAVAGVGTAVDPSKYTANSPGYAFLNPDETTWNWNESGFNAKPAGYIDRQSVTADKAWVTNGTLNLWTSYCSSTRGWCVKIACYNSGVNQANSASAEGYNGYSVRCVNDKEFK